MMLYQQFICFCRLIDTVKLIFYQKYPKGNKFWFFNFKFWRFTQNLKFLTCGKGRFKIRQTMKRTTLKLLFGFALMSIGFMSCESESQAALQFQETSQQTSTQKKGEKTIAGLVLEVDKLEEEDGLFFFLQDEADNTYSIDFLAADNPLTFSDLPKDLEGKKVNATYMEKVEPVVVEIIPVDVRSGFAGGAFEKITAYTLKATQLKVEDTPEGLKVTIQLGSGKEKTYRTDLQAYDGQDPSSFNGKPVNLTYIEDKRLLMKDLEILE